MGVWGSLALGPAPGWELIAVISRQEVVAGVVRRRVRLEALRDFAGGFFQATGGKKRIPHGADSPPFRIAGIGAKGKLIVRFECGRCVLRFSRWTTLKVGVSLRKGARPADNIRDGAKAPPSEGGPLQKES